MHKYTVGGLSMDKKAIDAIRKCNWNFEMRAITAQFILWFKEYMMLPDVVTKEFDGKLYYKMDYAKASKEVAKVNGKKLPYMSIAQDFYRMSKNGVFERVRVPTEHATYYRFSDNTMKILEEAELLVS